MTLGDSFMIYSVMYCHESLLDDSDDAIRVKLGKIWPGHVSLLEKLKKFCAPLQAAVKKL